MMSSMNIMQREFTLITFYVGSELMEVALVTVVLDINYLQMGFMFDLYGLFQQTNVYYNNGLVYEDYLFLIVFA